MPIQNFPAVYKSLTDINAFVLSVARQIGFSSKELYAIELSVNEACANIIDHAYQGEGLGTIEVIAVASKDALKVILRDQGVPFNPDEVPSPDVCSPLDDRCERGLGVYTMRKLMDEVVYDFSQPGVNSLIMVKHKRACP
ncbi:MAG: ATP-binding protein [Anaerolineaceae bacterium]